MTAPLGPAKFLVATLQPLGKQPVLTFVCDRCGTVGRAPAPGAAQCSTCGHVAIAGLDGDPAATPAPPRLATLWVRPGPEESSTPDPVLIPPRRSTLRSAATALALLTSGAALALGAAAALRGGAGAKVRPATAGEPAALARAPAETASADVAAPAPTPRPASLGAVQPAPAAPSRRTVRSATAAAPAAAARAGIVPRIDALQDPSPADRRCVPRALRGRRELAGRLPPEIAVRFQVAASGAVGRVEVLGDVEDREAAAAIEEAVRACRFLPGSDEAGRPTALPVVMRIRFSSGGTF